MAILTIFHTNDLHDKLAPEKAERLSRMRSSISDPCLLLDAGDAVGSGNVTFRTDGEPIQTLMSDLGYDGMAVGNREFHLTQSGFTAKTKLARFPVLSANIRPRSPAVTIPCAPFIKRDVDGFGPVAIFGITVPMITERMAVRHLSAYVFDDPEQTARVMAERLRSECALLVCLSHAGLGVDRRIAQANIGIDLIVGGHTHAELNSGERHGSTIIVQAGSHARFLGRVTVSGQDASLSVSAELVPL